MLVDGPVSTLALLRAVAHLATPQTMHTRGRRGHGGVHVSLPFVTPHLWSIVAKFGQASGRLNLLTPLRPPPALVRKGTLWPEVGFTSASFDAQLGSVLQDARLLVYARSLSL